MPENGSEQALIERLAMDQAVAWLQEKWGDRECRCGAKDWGVAGPMQMRLAKGYLTVALIPVTCGNCGLMEFINGTIIGSFKAETEPKGVGGAASPKDVSDA